jgi:hypothetical protein
MVIDGEWSTVHPIALPKRLIIFGALGFTAVLGHGALDYWWDPYPPFQPWMAIS